MKRYIWTALAVLVSLAFVVPAEARRSKASLSDRSEWSEEQDARPAKRRHEARNFWEDSDGPSSRPARHSRHRHVASYDGESRSSSRHSVGGRPGAWCGWWMRTQKGGGPDLNLAWNWSRWGSHASGPQVGAVVVWRHHVGEITGRASNGQWIVKSGNDGGRVRERPRSVAGAVFRVG